MQVLHITLPGTDYAFDPWTPSPFLRVLNRHSSDDNLDNFSPFQHLQIVGLPFRIEEEWTPNAKYNDDKGKVIAAYTGKRYTVHNA